MMDPMKRPPERTSFCPNCGNVSRHRVIHEHSYRAAAGAGREIDSVFIVASCETCNEPLVYVWTIDGHAAGGEPFHEADLVWPDDGELHSAVPPVIRETYREAIRIQRLTPTAFAVQVGRALEYLCKDRKTGGTTLQKQLDSLAKRGEIPGALTKMSSTIRILRNSGAHATGVKVSELDAEAIDGFFRSVIEYVYVAPFKLEEYRRRVKEAGKK